MDERPGREISKEYREIAQHLVDAQGWRYRTGKRHPKLYPAEPTQSPIPVPTTPSDRRSLKNFVSQVRRAGGIWPPPKGTR